jgi:hypothetical protein
MMHYTKRFLCLVNLQFFLSESKLCSHFVGQVLKLVLKNLYSNLFTPQFCVKATFLATKHGLHSNNVHSYKKNNTILLKIMKSISKSKTTCTIRSIEKKCRIFYFYSLFSEMTVNSGRNVYRVEEFTIMQFQNYIVENFIVHQQKFFLLHLMKSTRLLSCTK